MQDAAGCTSLASGTQPETRTAEVTVARVLRQLAADPSQKVRVRLFPGLYKPLGTLV